MPLLDLTDLPSEGSDYGLNDSTAVPGHVRYRNSGGISANQMVLQQSEAKAKQSPPSLFKDDDFNLLDGDDDDLLHKLRNNESLSLSLYSPTP